jgi:paraquat-inducible protein B
MARRANPGLIGAFVLGGLALGVLLLALFGSLSFFSETRHFVVVFKSSLHGLSVGAPVALRGVPVGQVTAISPLVIVKEGQPTGVDILVTLEVNRGQFRTSEGTPATFQEMTDAELAKVFDREGVRAQLAMQSFVTGQLYVNLDFFPGSPRNVADVETPYPQLGTMQSGLERLGKTIETLPLDQLAAQAVAVLEGLQKTINAPEIPKILAALQETTTNLQTLSKKLDANLEPLVGQLGAAAEATTGAMNQARETLALKQGPAAEVVDRLNGLAHAADGLLATAQTAAKEAALLLNSRSTTRQRLEQALTEFQQAARSIRSLADYLDRHPEAVLRGRR